MPGVWLAADDTYRVGRYQKRLEVERTEFKHSVYDCTKKDEDDNCEQWKYSHEELDRIDYTFKFEFTEQDQVANRNLEGVISLTPEGNLQSCAGAFCLDKSARVIAVDYWSQRSGVTDPYLRSQDVFYIQAG